MPRREPSTGVEIDASETPRLGTGRRWTALIVLVGLVTAAGIGERLARPDGSDRRASSPPSGGWNTPAVDVTRRGGFQVGSLESSVGHGSLRTSAQYVDDAAAICDAATVRFRAATTELGYPADQAAWDAAAVRYSEGALAKLRALTLPKMKGQRARFVEYQALVRRAVDALRRMAAAVSTGHTVRADGLAAEVRDLIHRKDEREPELRSCPIALEG